MGSSIEVSSIEASVEVGRLSEPAPSALDAVRHHGALESLRQRGPVREEIDIGLKLNGR
jgi:hypothetical protein